MSRYRIVVTDKGSDSWLGDKMRFQCQVEKRVWGLWEKIGPPSYWPSRKTAKLMGEFRIHEHAKPKSSDSKKKVYYYD